MPKFDKFDIDEDLLKKSYEIGSMHAKEDYKYGDYSLYNTMKEYPKMSWEFISIYRESHRKGYFDTFEKLVNK